jgi:hypothetical protein
LEWNPKREETKGREPDRQVLAVLRPVLVLRRRGPLQAATRSEVERPMHWYCPGCEVRWYAYADRVEAPAPLLVS